MSTLKEWTMDIKKRQNFIDSSKYCKKCEHINLQQNFLGGDNRFHCPECRADCENIVSANELFTINDLCPSCGLQIVKNDQECLKCSTEIWDDSMENIDDLFTPGDFGPGFDH